MAKEDEGLRPMRYVLELIHDGAGVCGWLERDGSPVESFSGWLELLGILDRTCDTR